MRKKTLAVATTLMLLLVGGSAYALEIRVGNLIVIGDGGFSPKSLPRFHDAPITIHGGGKLSTVSGCCRLS